MKIEVWEPAEPDPEVEKVLQLRFREREQAIFCDAVDKNGYIHKRGWLLTIGVNGVRREQNINPDFGLPLDDKGRVVLVGE